MKITKTTEEIEQKFNWLCEEVDKPENKDDLTQCKLWGQIDCLLWLQGERSI